MKKTKKYEPLGNFLTNLQDQENTITLSFERIKEIIGEDLPESAYQHRAWWANQEGGSRAPNWRRAGFKVEPVNLEQEKVTFSRVGVAVNTSNPKKSAWLENPSITELTDAIECQAAKFSFGDLQRIRKNLKSLKPCSQTIFKEKTIFENGEYSYAFHYGGRTELQFNIGFEYDENDKWKLRHGLAISLQTGRAIHQIDEAIRTRFSRLNKYIKSHAEKFSGFFMYVYDQDKDTQQRYDEVRPIPQKGIKLDTFTFIGKYQNPSRISIEQILRDFDLLLPMYIFVERGETTQFAHGTVNSGSEPGLVEKPSSTIATKKEQILKIDLRHNDIQLALGKYLIQHHGKDKVHQEFATVGRNRVDLVVEENKNLTYYEIKVCHAARLCIRQAIGQLLEYSYWPHANRAAKLIVVGEPVLDMDAKNYLEELRKKFKLPIHYQQFDVNAGMLIV